MTQENTIDAGSLDTGGVTFDDREFLSGAIKTAGGEITDGGFGLGGADLGYRLNGKVFSVNLKLRQEEQAKAA